MRKQRESDLETSGPHSAKLGFPYIFTTWLSRDVDVQAWSFQVSVAGSVHKGQMKIAAVLRNLLANEWSDQQGKFCIGRQLCFDLSRSPEPVNRFDFDHKTPGTLISSNLDQRVDAPIGGARFMCDNGGQTGGTFKGGQSGVDDVVRCVIVPCMLHDRSQ